MDLTPVTTEASDSVAHDAGGVVREPLRFNGKGGEYFRIWIVNLCLTIVTLGVYSAWAKVRKNRYIYGNLELAGSNFDYLASPLQILRGRLIAIGLLIAYVVTESIVPLFGVGLLTLLTLITPWLVVRSRMFNMHYTAYRNIRFGFRPVYGEAYKVIIGYGLLSLISFGLLVPYAHYRRNRMIVDNTRFGNLNLHLEATPGQFFMAYGVGAALGIMLLVPLQWAASGALGNVDPQAPVSAIVMLLPALLIGLFYFVVGQFVKAYILQLVTKGTSVGNELGQTAQLGCDWSLAGILGIYVSNIIAIVFSFGLLIPWAQMRILRYQLNQTWLDVPAGLDSVMAGLDRQVSSIGEEIGDVFDVDIGL